MDNYLFTYTIDNDWCGLIPLCSIQDGIITKDYKNLDENLD
jgi:hypothetical protein